MLINPREVSNEVKDPIPLAYITVGEGENQSGHYQSLKPKRCDNCNQTWASKVCPVCSASHCRACQCNACPLEVQVYKYTNKLLIYDI
jgi:hypothetical protein